VKRVDAEDLKKLVLIEICLERISKEKDNQIIKDMRWLAERD